MPAPPTAETALTRDIDGKLRSRPTDREIGELAREQHGVVSRAQLVELGFGEDAIDSRLSSGRLCWLHRGVYAVGHGIVPTEGKWMAAVLASGREAILSHHSAAELWGIRRKQERRRIDVSVARSARSPGAIRRHHVRLVPSEVTSRHGIAVTTLARTLFDIAAELSEESLEAAIREAEYLHRFHLQRLESLLDRHPGRRGAAAIKACLYRLGRGPRGRTRSQLEVRFAALLASSDLPKPELNSFLDLDGFKVQADCLWRDQKVIVELDGRKAHGTRAAFEADRERDRRLQAAGWRVIRLTWRQLDDPAVLEDLGRLLLIETALTRGIGGKLQSHISCT
jgi:Protein of unknown function (DUF559)/AbiEi antitoxin C-terminal domain